MTKTAADDGGSERAWPGWRVAIRSYPLEGINRTLLELKQGPVRGAKYC